MLSWPLLVWLYGIANYGSCSLSDQYVWVGEEPICHGTWIECSTFDLEQLGDPVPCGTKTGNKLKCILPLDLKNVSHLSGNVYPANSKAHSISLINVNIHAYPFDTGLAGQVERICRLPGYLAEKASHVDVVIIYDLYIDECRHEFTFSRLMRLHGWEHHTILQGEKLGGLIIFSKLTLERVTPKIFDSSAKSTKYGLMSVVLKNQNQNLRYFLVAMAFERHRTVIDEFDLFSKYLENIRFAAGNLRQTVEMYTKHNMPIIYSANIPIDYLRYDYMAHFFFYFLKAHLHNPTGNSGQIARKYVNVPQVWSDEAYAQDFNLYLGYSFETGYRLMKVDKTFLPMLFHSDLNFCSDAGLSYKWIFHLSSKCRKTTKTRLLTPQAGYMAVLHFAN